MHYFSNKFLKSPSGDSPPAPLNLSFWWPEVTWCGQIVFYQADYDEIELQKISYDVIIVTHHHYVIEKRLQK